jgi:hypothetical protein
MLPGFTVDRSAQVRLADTISNLALSLAAHPAWFDHISALDVQLEGGQIGASMAFALADLERRGVTVSFTPSAGKARPQGVGTRTRDGIDAAPAAPAQGGQADRGFVEPGGSPVVRTRIAQLEALADLQIVPDGITVCDSAAAISGDLALRGSSAILALLPQIRAIDVMDGGMISLTAAQALTGGVDDGLHCALTLVKGGRLAITDARVAQLSQLRRLQVAPERIEIADDADTVIAHIDQLCEAGNAVRVCLNDIWLQAAQVGQLARLSSALASGVPVRDSASQIAALVDAADAAAIAYMNVHGAVLCADGIVAVSDIAALQMLSGFDKAGYRLIVWDTAARLTAPGTAAILATPLIDTIFLRTVDGTAIISAAVAAALFALPAFSAANPDGSVNHVTIRDSAAAILSCYAQIAAPGNAVSRIVISEGGLVDAVSLGRLEALGATLAPGTTLAMCDTAALLAGAADGGVIGLATKLTLSGPETVNAAAAKALLSAKNFVASHTLTIADNAANLQLTGLAAVIRSLPRETDIKVRLVAPEALDAATAALLAALPHFTDPAGYLTVLSDMTGARSDGRPIVTLGGAEPAPTASLVRHSNRFLAAGGSAGNGTNIGAMNAGAMNIGAMNLGSSTLGHEDVPVAHNAISLKAVAELSADISRGSADIALVLNKAAGTASDYANQHRNSVSNDHTIMRAGRLAAGPLNEADIEAALPPAPANGATRAKVGATVNVYGETGSLLSATVEQPSGFTVTAPDTGRGQAFSITESVDGRESAPVVVLDAGILEHAVAAAHAEFASSGAIEVENGKYLDLYNAGDVPVLDRPALVYDPSAHTIALDIPGQAPLPLIVLGAQSTPRSLDVSEIIVKQAS